MSNHVFNAFMPVDLTKSVSTDNEVWTVSGYASDGSLDFQNEIVDPKGIDISYFVNHGYINAEHNKDNIIGYPTDNTYVDKEKGLFVEAKIFKNSEHAQNLMTLADNLEKTGSNRKIGFSIEGVIKSRDVADKRIISKVMITGLAITARPANPNATIETIIKSFQTGHFTDIEDKQDASALRREALAEGITRLTYALKPMDKDTLDNTWTDVVNSLQQENKMGYEESVIVLQLSKGLSREDAEEAVMKIRKNKLQIGG